MKIENFQHVKLFYFLITLSCISLTLHISIYFSKDKGICFILPNFKYCRIAYVSGMACQVFILVQNYVLKRYAIVLSLLIVFIGWFLIGYEMSGNKVKRLIIRRYIIAIINGGYFVLQFLNLWEETSTLLLICNGTVSALFVLSLMCWLYFITICPIIEKDYELVDTDSLSELVLLFSVSFDWFTDILNIGATTVGLDLADLPALPQTMTSAHSLAYLHTHIKLMKEKTIRVLIKKDSSSHQWMTPLQKVLLRLLFTSHFKDLLVLGCFKLFLLILSFGGPVLLGQLVHIIEKSPTQEDLEFGLILVFLLFASVICSAILNTWYNMQASVLQVKICSSLSALVFQIGLSLPLYEQSKLNINDGKLSNLVLIDVQRIADLPRGLNDLWSLPCQIIIAFILLYLQVNIAFLAGVFIMILMFPINRYITQQIQEASLALMKHKDNRVKLATEILRGIKMIKMSSLEIELNRICQYHRVLETKQLSRKKYLDALCVFLWASMPLLVPYATFVVSVVVLDHELSASKVFTTIALLSMLIFPMNAFPWILNGVVEALVSVDRVATVICETKDDGDGSNRISFRSAGESHVLSSTDYIPPSVEPGSALSASRVKDNKDISICVEGLTASWRVNNLMRMSSIDSNRLTDSTIGSQGTNASSHESDGAFDSLSSHPLIEDHASRLSEGSCVDLQSLSDLTFVVGPVSFQCHASDMMCIVGPVACGKSTLMLGILCEVYTSHDTPSAVDSDREVNGSEMSSHRGISETPVSFCAQIPALHSGTVRSNVCFESIFAEERYVSVMHGTGLDIDFPIMTQNYNAKSKNEPNDLMDIGQAGSKLSGGQKLRVGIARALYAHTKVILLDDPFSALDKMTATHLMLYLNHICSTERRTIIFTTHSITLLETCNPLIVVIDEGTEVMRGNFSKLKAQCSIFSNMLASCADADSSHKNSSEETIQDKGQLTLAEATDSDTHADVPEVAPDNEEHMERGHIKSSVLYTYFSIMGWVTMSVILLSTILMQGSANGMGYWLAYWTDHIDSISKDEFLVITSIIVVFNVFFALVRSFSFAYGGLKVAKLLYYKLSESTLNTYVDFFEKTPIGRVINRFVKDSDCVDDQLPFILNILLAQVFILLGTIIIISLSSPLCIAILLLVGVVYYELQLFYRNSSRDLRRINSLHRSAVGSILLECMSNVVTIRALKLQRRFEENFQNAVDTSQRVSVSSTVASQWLGIRLQLLGTCVTTSVALLAVVNSIYDIIPTSASMLGLSLTYSFALVNSLNGLLNSFSETEQEFVSVERIGEYLQLPSEYQHYPGDAQCATTTTAKPCKWGDITGPIQFRHVCFSYEHNMTIVEATSSKLQSRLVLEDVTFTVPMGSRLAVVGRSGSGKSTLMRLLLRLNEEYSGEITLGGMNLKDIPKQWLRQHVGVISQEPLLFSGTVRFNLDPTGKYSDGELAHALDKCGLMETFRENSDVMQSIRNQRSSFQLTHEALLDLQLDDGSGISSSLLSVGQKQIFSLARVLLTKANILILDEASSSMDASTEAMLLGRVKDMLTPSTTVLVISHHPERRIVHELCDMTIELANGKIVKLEGKRLS